MRTFTTIIGASATLSLGLGAAWASAAAATDSAVARVLAADHAALGKDPGARGMTAEYAFSGMGMAGKVNSRRTWPTAASSTS